MIPATLPIVSLAGITLPTCIVDLIRSTFYQLVLKMQGKPPGLQEALRNYYLVD